MNTSYFGFGGQKSSYLMRAAKLRGRFAVENVRDTNNVALDESTDEASSQYGLFGSEEAELHGSLRTGEHIRAIIHGYSDLGFTVIAATDERLLFIDKKLLFTEIDETPYDSLTGVSYKKKLFYTDIVLHLRTGDYKIITLNAKRAQHFIRYIEGKYLIDRVTEVVS